MADIITLLNKFCGFVRLITTLPDEAEDDEQSTLESDVAVACIEPLVQRVRVAGSAARAKCDGRDTKRDGDVGIG